MKLAMFDDYKLGVVKGDTIHDVSAAVADIADGASIMIGGFGTAGMPDELIEALIERGVRFIQLYSGGGHIEDTWDGHNDCVTNHRTHAGETDQPIAALIADLKRTGLWEETLLVWGGEFGRTPTSEGVDKPGRDHDWHGFTMWLAGAGVKGGQAIGATDELGFNAVDGRVSVPDWHATILHLLGLNYDQLYVMENGLRERLTGVAEARVVSEILK